MYVFVCRVLIALAIAFGWLVGWWYSWLFQNRFIVIAYYLQWMDGLWSVFIIIIVVVVVVPLHKDFVVVTVTVRHHDRVGIRVTLIVMLFGMPVIHLVPTQLPKTSSCGKFFDKSKATGFLVSMMGGRGGGWQVRCITSVVMITITVVVLFVITITVRYTSSSFRQQQLVHVLFELGPNSLEQPPLIGLQGGFITEIGPLERVGIDVFVGHTGPFQNLATDLFRQDQIFVIVIVVRVLVVAAVRVRPIVRDSKRMAFIIVIIIITVMMMIEMMLVQSFQTGGTPRQQLGRRSHFVGSFGRIQNLFGVLGPQLIVRHSVRLKATVLDPLPKAVKQRGGDPGRYRTPFAGVQFGRHPGLVRQRGQILRGQLTQSAEIQEGSGQQRLVEATGRGGLEVAPELVLVGSKMLPQSFHTGIAFRPFQDFVFVGNLGSGSDGACACACACSAGGDDGNGGRIRHSSISALRVTTGIPKVVQEIGQQRRPGGSGRRKVLGVGSDTDVLFGFV